MTRRLLLGWVLLGFAAAAGSQPLRWQIKPESLPNWGQVEFLSEGLIATDPKVRERAEAELLALGTPALHPLLFIGIRNLPQSKAVQLIWPKFGDAFISEAIDLEISGGSLAPCQAAAGMGSSLVPELVKLMAKEDHRAERFAFCVLRQMGSDGIPALMELARDQQLDTRKRGIAIDLLMMSRDQRASQVFLEGLSDKKPGIVQGSARGLAALKDPRVISKLVEMAGAQGERGAYREVALRGLGAMYSASVRDVIARAAWQDDEMEVRKAAANALVGHGDRVAERIGGRYFPVRYSFLFPYLTWGPRIGAGAFFVCLAAWLAARRRWAIGVALGAVVGIYWGFFASDVWIETEVWLLAGFVPAALISMFIFGCSGRALGVVLAWALANAFAGLAMLLTPLFGLGAMASVVGGPYVFPFLALIGLFYHRETDPDTLARDRRSAAVVGAAFYSSYAISFAGLWGYLGF